VFLNCLLNFLRFDADVSLRGGCGTVLKEPLYQRYVNVTTQDGIALRPYSSEGTG
jgi:hypothetical protein